MERHPLCLAVRSITRHTWLLAALAFATLAWLVLATATTRAQQPATPALPFHHDSALTCVCFIDAQQGWAVGDRGLILHTGDGGATWQQQLSNTVIHLASVHFIDPQHGWVVGGVSLPRQSATQGIVLRTTDGGATWSEVAQASRGTLPRLTGVKFFDPSRGIAFGEPAPLAPSGVFATTDAGQTWQPLAADSTGHWLAGDFLDPQIGALAGPPGQLATLARHKVTHSPLAASSLRAIRAIRLIEPAEGWAVGDGALLLTTHDGGRTWQTPPTELPPTLAECFDFRALAVHGTHVWTAGSPGSRLFHSFDSGHTWESFSTGLSAPVRALQFVDAANGWAVGDLGNILVTHDGGRSWASQRTGGSRAAVLALFAEPTNVPLELLADSGAAEGYLAVIDTLAATAHEPGIANAANSDNDFTPSQLAAVRARATDALLLAGATSTNAAWRFPLPAADLAHSPADVLAALNRENDGRALEQLQRHLVRELRTWRPEVIIIHHATPTSSPSLGDVVEPLVLQAVQSAADPAQFPELSSEAGLAAWQVKKVYGVMPPGESGDEQLATGRFSPWLGGSLADFTAPARNVLHLAPVPPPDSHEFKLLSSTVPPAAGAPGIFGGIALAPGGDARRPTADLPSNNLDSLRQLATRRRHLQEIIERSEGNAAWAAQVASLIEGLDPNSAGELLAQLGDDYRRAGRLDLAADTYFLLARQAPDHPLTSPALDWLLHFYASAEVAHRLQRTQGTATPADNRRNYEVNAAPVQQTLAQVPSYQPTLARDDRLRRASQLADYLGAARPALYADPAVGFAHTTAQRELGFANPAQRFYLTLRNLPETNPWRECAAAEEWLAHPGEEPPTKKLATCRPAADPPKLDAILDDPLWQHADKLRLSNSPSRLSAPPSAPSPPASLSALVHLAHDQQYLYVAIHCPKAANCDYTPDDSARPRDAQLVEHDRVTLHIDTDRDYTTAFELTVDHRGFTHDACWGDATWNPTWYVAATSDDTTWTIEAAIPLAELAEKPPAARAVWAISAIRTIPRTGYETWCGPTTSAPTPAHFGLLLFQ
ncbi:MAG: hypothetical protein IT425_08370 [Pirellulales bacterium]|nr:hypothetical protein [Pirellulales bacterium]